MKLLSFWTSFFLTSGLVQASVKSSGIEAGLIDVGSNIQLAYTDSGKPENATNYHTIFALHGFGFNANVFNKTQSLASQNGFRFVSINRRNYQQSTPYLPGELSTINNGTDEQYAKFHQDRGLEILQFLVTYIQEQDIPVIQEDGKSGGATLVGWSLGNSFSLSAMANADILSEESRTIISSRFRGLIIQQTSAISLGLPAPTEAWWPISDPTIDPSEQIPFLANWASSYFTNKDITSKNLSSLSWVTPSISRVPTIYNMSQSEYDSVVEPVENVSPELTWMNKAPQKILLETYRKAIYSASIRELFPNMRVHTFAGSSSGGIEIQAHWSLESDNQNQTLGQSYGIDSFDILPDVNHFAMWDEPEALLALYKKLLSQSV